MAFGTRPWYRRRALLEAGLDTGMTVVDVGVGTGLVAREAAAIVGDPACVIGVDPSPGMVSNARVPKGLRLLAGSAEHLPVPSATDDFVSMGFALRHVDDLAVGFWRILPGTQAWRARLCARNHQATGGLGAGNAENVHAPRRSMSGGAPGFASGYARTDALLLRHH